ncbi:MAG: N-acetyltransferase family protein [Pseudomonadota bacterium]
MLRIRRATKADADFIAQTYRPFVESHWASFEETAPGATEIAARIEAAGDFYPWLIAGDDEPLAFAYASAHRSRAAYSRSVETSVYTAPDARGKGISKQLYLALLSVLTDQNYIMAFAGIVVPNNASIGIHKAVGFEWVGTYPNVGFKLGAWRDTQWWGRPLAMPSTPPAKIRPVSDVFAVK